MPSCVESFCRSDIEGAELQGYIDEVHPNFICENERCSPYSPGRVLDDEKLAFLLVHPLHYDEHLDVVTPSAFQELTNRDLSTLRASFVNKAEAEMTRTQLVLRGSERVPAQTRLVDEVCIASVADIRSCLEGGNRTMAIYDTALDQIRSHASVFTNARILVDRKLRKLVRNQIYEVFTINRTKFSMFLEGIPDRLEIEN